jgi:GT2 family glycosyltransferase
MTAERPQVSVVIPTFANPGPLARVLDAFERQAMPEATFEVIVVGDPADPDLDSLKAVVAAARRPYRARVLMGEAPGASANRNAGWHAADSPLVVFCDDDTVPVPTFLSEHSDWHARWPELRVVVVGIVRWAPEVRVTAFMRWLEDGIQFDFNAIEGTEASWAHVYSSNCSIKREFLEQVGGYDEQRLPYGYEDLDWGYRAQGYGLRVLLNREAVADHLRTMTLAQWQARAPRLAASEWTFCGLHPDVPPAFQRMFAEAAELPRCAGRAARLAEFLPRGTPWLGERVWARASLYWRQQIAPYFLEAWDRMERGEVAAPQPAVSALNERSDSSAGS